MIIVYVASLSCTLVFIILLICFIWIRTKPMQKSVCIVVLGDIGRSPRMQNHALSYANESYAVDLVGYSGSEPFQKLTKSSNVNIHYLHEIPDHPLLQGIPRFFQYLLKTVFSSTVLMMKLLQLRRPRFLLVQNPPAIPTIPICWLYSICAESTFSIDWHNYAYTIMSLNVGKNHILVKMTEFVESFVGARAEKHYCVSNAMKEDLLTNWNIRAKVLYDRPTPRFGPIGVPDKHSLFMKLKKAYKIFDDGEYSTIFTECLENPKTPHASEIRLKSKRPGLIVSSTSWTTDEDFSILFDALNEYEIFCTREDNTLPSLICVITGKGPLQTFWSAIIERKKWHHITVVTPWLENEDYPKLLASADLGVCLHTSSSGLDLPMKIVDMFGCELPVCAYNYNCLNELVKDGINSYVFNDAKELASTFVNWFHDFPDNEEQRRIKNTFQSELKKFRLDSWHGNWCRTLIES